VADVKRDAPRPFDVHTVEHLLKLMTEHDLAVVDLQEGDQRIRLRKAVAIPPTFLPAPATYTHAAPVQAGIQASVPAATPATASPAPPSAPARKYHEIKSEVVGTFFTRPHPDKPEYVKVGSRVTPDTTVAIVMAMKVNNEIKAECTGTIVEIVAKNEQPVDYNAVLFRVDTGS
jgi:acetyl-CoA carboxylase biotin carboxyl carrier protein